MSDRVEIVEGRAIDSLRRLEGPFDLVFIDADKTSYPDYYEAVVPLVRPGGLIVADNVLWSGQVLDGGGNDPNTAAPAASSTTSWPHDPRVECAMLTDPRRGDAHPPPAVGSRVALTVLYDAHCRLCTRIAARLAAMDRLDRLRFVPLQVAAHDRPEVRGARGVSRPIGARSTSSTRTGAGSPGARRWCGSGSSCRRCDHSPGFARLPVVRSLVEPAYRFVAEHRPWFGFLAGSSALLWRAARRMRLRRRWRANG